MSPRKPITKLAWARWLVLLPIPALWCVAAYLGELHVLETLTLRWRYLARGEIPAPVNLHYVDLDTRAVQEVGERPWSRADFATVARALTEVGHAKAVAFDFVFSDYGMSKMVSRDELKKRNLEFGRVTRNHPEIILGAQYSGGQAYLQEGQRNFPLLRLGHGDRSKNDLPELPQFPLTGTFVDRATGQMKGWGTVGLIDVDYAFGGDEMPRWAPLFAHTPSPTFYHLSLQLALIELGLDESAIRLSAEALELVSPAGAVVRSIPLREGQLLEVNWFSPWDSPRCNPRTSFADVLLNERDLSSTDPQTRAQAEAFFTRFNGALVLVGPVDPMLQDLAPTPFDPKPVPGVGFHGNLVKTIVSGRFIKRVSEPAGMGLTVLLAMAVTALSVRGGVKKWRFKLAAILVLGGFVAVAFVAFERFDLVLPMAAPLGAAFTTSFAGVIWQLVDEQKQRSRIKGMFGTYVSPQLVDRMVESGESPQLGGHDAEITAYFSDIQSFSTFSEKLGSGPLVELMNEYLTACTDIVQEEGGTLDKYIGDAVVAMFGAPIALPDHAYRACVASQRVHRQLAELRRKWQAEGAKWPEIVGRMQSRIGLNTGVCMIGNMGSRTRFNYTMMGDNVNLAARMESGAKSWGVYSMCTDATREACLRHGGDRVVFRPLGRIVVKGRTQPVPIFEIVGLREDVTDRMRECIASFEDALARYYARDWQGALERFARSAELEPNVPGVTPGVSSNPSLVYLNRVVPEAIESPPPADWDGVYVMKEK